ncbi:hypothetical protein CN671_22080 [Bacillus toyonensis]|nr:hypothetical protein CN671_22080 [Bacillus toyonensis]
MNIRKVTILLLFVDICRFECYIHNNKERVNKKPLSSNVSEFLVFSTYVLLVSKKFVHFFPLFLCSPYIRKQSVFIQVVFFALQRPAKTWSGFAICFVIKLVVYFNYGKKIVPYKRDKRKMQYNEKAVVLLGQQFLSYWYKKIISLSILKVMKKARHFFHY